MSLLTSIQSLANGGRLVITEEEVDVVSDVSLDEPRAARQKADISYWVILGCIAVAGMVLRLWDLDGISIWGDEVFEGRESVSVYRLDIVAGLEGFVGHFASLLALLVSGANLQGLEPSDFGAFRDAGITSSSLRLAPAVIGSLTIPVVGIMTRRFLGRRESLVLALLLAVAPWHLYWSQGARFYAIQFLFYAIAFIWYFEATESGSSKRLALAMLFFVLAFNAQYTSFVLIPIIAADWLIGRLTDRPPRLDARSFAIIGIGVACAVAMPLFLLLQVDSYTANHFETRGSPPWHIAFGIIVLIHPVVVATAVVSASLRDTISSRKRVYLLLGGFLPILLMSAMSFRSFSGSRYGFVALFPMLALAAVGLVHLYDVLAPRVGRLVAVLPFLLVLGTYFIADADYYLFNRGFRPQWETAAEVVLAQHEPGEKVAMGLNQLGRYLLEEDLGEDVVIGLDTIEREDAGVWVITTSVDSQTLLDESVLGPSHWVQSFVTRYVLPRHRIDVWYVPSEADPRQTPPEPDL